MWDQIKRAVRSNLGRFRDDPLASGASPRDAEELRAHIATVREHISLLEKDRVRLRDEETVVAAQVKQALKAGQRDLALEHAERLRQIRADAARIDEQLSSSRRVCAKAERLEVGPGAPSAGRGELERAADATLARLEASLGPGAVGATPATARPRPKIVVNPTSLGSRSPEESPAVSRKTIADDSGPVAKPHPSSSLERSGEGAVPKTIGDELLPPPSAASPDVAPAEPFAAEQQARKEMGIAEPPAPEPPPPAPVASAKPASDLIGELERLGRLKEHGLLSDEEFERAKKQLLGL